MPSRVARARCADVVPRVIPVIVPRASGSQCGAPSPEPRQGRDEDHPVARGDALREALYIFGALDDAEAVSQPLHGGAGDESAPLERIRRLALDPPRRGRDEPVVAQDRPLADVHQRERARAVGTFRVPFAKARLTEEGSLLVTGDARDRQAVGQEPDAARPPDLLGAPHDLRQDALGDAKEGA
jgi:hypothetical protein